MIQISRLMTRVIGKFCLQKKRQLKIWDHFPLLDITKHKLILALSNLLFL
jgi:hypothetical protein